MIFVFECLIHIFYFTLAQALTAGTFNTAGLYAAIGVLGALLALALITITVLFIKLSSQAAEIQEFKSVSNEQAAPEPASQYERVDLRDIDTRPHTYDSVNAHSVEYEGIR